MPGSAGDLTRLTAQDSQSGAIDQQAAQQVSNGLTNILNPYETGNTANAQQQLSNLSQQMRTLEQQGHITAAAAPALNRAVANLSTALTLAPAITTHALAELPQGTPPGHGGISPGKAKKARLARNSINVAGVPRSRHIHIRHVSVQDYREFALRHGHEAIRPRTDLLLRSTPCAHAACTDKRRMTNRIICEPDEKNHLVGVEGAPYSGYACTPDRVARLAIAAAASSGVRLSVLTTMS